MMEYFTVNGEPKNLTLQDMIECDIKSEFGEQCGSQVDLGLKVHLTDQPGSVADALNLNMDFSAQTGLDRSCGNSTLTSISGDAQTQSQDLSWMETVNTSDIQAVVLQPHPHIHQENSNDGASLLVNPQTGVPVTQNQGLQSPHSHSAISTPAVPATAAVSAAVTVEQPMSPAQQPMSPMSPSPVITSSSLLNSPVSINISSNRNQFTINSPSNQSRSQPTMIRPQVTHVYQHPLTAQQLLLTAKQQRLQAQVERHVEERSYPKPVYSYSCLIAMALKNSETGALPVSEIYSFMIENFPYFKTAPDGWKNSVRHNLSLNKCFEKIENPKANGNTRKGCLWGLNPQKIEKMDEEITKWRKKDPMSVKRSMAKPEVLELLEMGRLGSSSPRHPNNIKNMKNNNHINGTVQQVSQSPMKVTMTAVDTADDIISASAAETTVRVKTEPHMIHIVNIPEASKLDSHGVPVKSEEGRTGTVHGEVDLNILDGGLMDSQLPDLQGNLWDELGAEGINLDDLAASSLNFSFASVSSGTASPVTAQSGPGVTASPLVTLLTNRTVPSSPVTTIPISRTLFAAQT